jgi:4,5:9,10-diseco-3-hydroxy-5,9,17-trioxoandrosta-1(10),2-diene-4-oate hydrolase
MEPLPFKGLEQGSYVQVGGRKIWVAQVGEGPALLLLHGGGPGATGASNFSRNVAPLAKHFRVIIPDLPGYGRSTKGIDPADPFGDLAAVMLGLLDELGLEKVHALGNSLGGACALRLVLERPERIDRLVLLGPGGIDTTGYPPTDGLKLLLGYYAGEGPTREKVATFLRNYLVFDGSAISDAVIDERFGASVDPETIANPPLQPPKDLSSAVALDLAKDARLRTVATPTLVFWGMEDRVNRPSGAHSLQQHMPNCDVYLFSRTGHWVQWERAAEFNAATIAFLSQSAAPRS